MRSLIVRCCLGLFLLTLGLQADTKAPTRVHADAKWLVHLDVATLTRSPIFSWVQDNLIDDLVTHIKAEPGFPELLAGWDIDPQSLLQKLLRSVTVMGYIDPSQEWTNPTPDSISVLIHLNPTYRKELESLAQLTGLTLTDSPQLLNKHFLYAYDSDGLFGLVINSDEKLLSATLNAARPEGIQLERFSVLQTYPELPDNPYFVGVVEDIADLLELDSVEARIFRFTKGVRIAVGETGESWWSQFEMRAKDEETARQIQSILNGIVSLGLLGADVFQSVRQDDELIIRGLLPQITNEGPEIQIIKLDQEFQSTEEFIETLVLKHIKQLYRSTRITNEGAVVQVIQTIEMDQLLSDLDSIYRQLRKLPDFPFRGKSPAGATLRMSPAEAIERAKELGRSEEEIRRIKERYRRLEEALEEANLSSVLIEGIETAIRSEEEIIRSEEEIIRSEEEIIRSKEEIIRLEEALEEANLSSGLIEILSRLQVEFARLKVASMQAHAESMRLIMVDILNGRTSRN